MVPYATLHDSWCQFVFAPAPEEHGTPNVRNGGHRLRPLSTQGAEASERLPKAWKVLYINFPGLYVLNHKHSIVLSIRTASTILDPGMSSTSIFQPCSIIKAHRLSHDYTWLCTPSKPYATRS
jgi:hypothetical protein